MNLNQKYKLLTRQSRILDISNKSKFGEFVKTIIKNLSSNGNI